MADALIETPGEVAEDAPDDVVVLKQQRGGATLGALTALVCVGIGAWALNAFPSHSQPWWVAVIMLLGGAAGGAFAAIGALRPAQIILTADGLDYWAVFTSRSVAWEEVAAIGHVFTTRRYAKTQYPIGLRMVLLSGDHIDLPGGWPIATDAMLELLTDAWRQFTAAANEAKAKATQPTEGAPWGSPPPP